METETREKAIMTGHIPQCPHCKKPTKRSGGSSMSTAAYYPPIYDENGKNTNPDRNINTSTYSCYECTKNYTVSGNSTEGYYYK
jgi:hypothetical protein